MLTPSWPTSERYRREVPLRIRRRVSAAERRALRRAVSFGTAVMAALVLVDVIGSLMTGTDGASSLAPLELSAAGVAALAGYLARRAVWRAESLALIALLTVLAAALIGMTVMPAGRLLAVAQLGIILVGAGLFLPWDRRWHLGALAAATLMVAGFLVSPLASTFSAADRLNVIVAVLMAGGTSFIGHGLWQGRLRGMLVQQFELRHLSRYAQRQEAHVTELNRELNRVARRDSLTGVGNRLALDEAIAALLTREDRLRPPRFAIALFDIDHFKAYNDEHGHLAGDAALGWLGEVLRRATRGSDLAFRYGGEEFLLILPDADLAGAMAAAERVRMAATEEHPGGAPPFTLSGGVALCDAADGRNPEPLLRRADAALYLAKRAGRNRIAADELSVAMQREELASA